MYRKDIKKKFLNTSGETLNCEKFFRRGARAAGRKKLRRKFAPAEKNALLRAWSAGVSLAALIRKEVAESSREANGLHISNHASAPHPARRM